MNKAIKLVVVIISVVMLFSCSKTAEDTFAETTSSVSVSVNDTEVEASTIELVDTTQAELPEGLNLNVVGLPCIDSFSGTAIMEQGYRFPTVKSATYKYNGKEENVESDDPRLIRLLNFLSYGFEEDYHWWLQGTAEAEVVLEYYNRDMPMLEIEFYNDLQSEYSTQRSSKMIISGNYCALLIDAEHIDGVGENEQKFEVFLAYQELAYNICAPGLEEPIDSTAFTEFWGNNEYSWLDLAKYVGFDKE